MRETGETRSHAEQADEEKRHKHRWGACEIHGRLKLWASKPQCRWKLLADFLRMERYCFKLQRTQRLRTSLLQLYFWIQEQTSQHRNIQTIWVTPGISQCHYEHKLTSQKDQCKLRPQKGNHVPLRSQNTAAHQNRFGQNFRESRDRLPGAGDLVCELCAT